MARRLFVGGNWKCNNTFQETKDIVSKVYNKLVFDPKKVDVIAAPISLHLQWVMENVQKNVQVSSQNSAMQQFGAFTGELAPKHLKDFGLNWTILGHSERRQFYGDTNESVAKKLKLALDTKLNVIACCGEKLEDREADKTIKVIESQLEPWRKMLESGDWANVVVAYEPVWSIGTGKVATPEQAQEVHAFIRKWLSGVSSEVSKNTRIIYGGSVTGKTSDGLIKKEDIDGFLVGGASLKPDFLDIVKSCNQ